MLVQLSVTGGILIVLTAILRYFALNKLPKRIFVFLWDIIILRLLIAVSLPVHFGIAPPLPKAVDSSISVVYRTEHSTSWEAGNAASVGRDLSSGNLEWTTVVWFAGMVVLFVLCNRRYREDRSGCGKGCEL